MAKRFFHFKSHTDFSLYINGEYVDRSKEQESLDLLVTSESFSYMLCPIGGFLVENGVVYNGDKVTIEGSFVELVSYKENHYDINFIPQKIKNLSKNDTILQISEESISFVVYNNSNGVIDIEFKGSVKIFKQLNNIISMANVEKINDSYLISCLLEDNKRYILVVNMSGQLFESYCDDFVRDAVNIKMIALNKDIANTAKVVTYNLVSKQMDSYNVMVEDRPLVTTKELIPMAMLQAIKTENYQFAKKYLSESFEDVEDNQLINYFGRIEGIYYNRYLLNNDINYTIKVDGGYRSFDFEIKDNKIEDIKEVIIE